MTSRGARPAHRRTGFVPFLVAAGVTWFLVMLLAFTPTLSPLDVLAGRWFEVEVPTVTGLTQIRALVELEEARLNGRVTFAYSSKVGRGLVVSQLPAAGSFTDRWDTATVVVSRGPSRLVLPDLAGRTESDARSLLAQSDVSVRTVTVNDETVPKDQVMAQKPKPGTVVLGGSEVELTISSGPSTRQVPTLVGVPLQGAMFNLGRAGFSVGQVTFANSPDVPVAAVVSSDPAQGEIRAKDSPVNLVVSSGKPDVVVPQLVGLQISDATRLLTSSGLVVVEITETGRVGDPEAGSIRAQEPASGVSLRPGQAVALTVRRSAPPPTTTTTAPPTTLPPPTVAPPAPPAPPVAPGPGG